jgi:2-iminobutanoate/2-iminopropanoate deaminase
MVDSINPADVPHHKNPIPAAAIHRGILVSSAIFGLDPATQAYPPTRAEQVAMAFRHLQTILADAGASLQDVVKMDLFFADLADRSLVNPQWLALYPDADHRPARHAHQATLPDGCCLQIVVTAVVGSGD